MRRRQKPLEPFSVGRPIKGGMNAFTPIDVLVADAGYDAEP